MSGLGIVAEHLNSLGPIPKTMQAGVYRDKGVVRVEEVPVPEVGDGEVLIKVAACGVCGTDIKKIFQRYVEPPQILGHELAGTVVAVGRGVTKWMPGARVMSFHHTPCGRCFYCEKRLFSQCKQYKTTGLTAGFTPNGGGFAQYVKAMPWVAERRHHRAAQRRQLWGSRFHRAHQHHRESRSKGSHHRRRDRPRYGLRANRLAVAHSPVNLKAPSCIPAIRFHSVGRKVCPLAHWRRLTQPVVSLWKRFGSVPTVGERTQCWSRSRIHP